MTDISAQIIADSLGPKDLEGTRHRLTTMLLRYPRFIHAEVMTHRAFCRNASSSRAIPVERLIGDIERNPAIPLVWTLNRPGMQGDEISDQRIINSLKALWNEDREHSIMMARAVAEVGGHKQLANRLIEVHGHINVVLSATEWANFFHLRDHPAAEPHMRLLAQAMWKAKEDSVPRDLGPHQWHTPFVEAWEADHMTPSDAVLASVARCARTSYLTHELKTPKLADDLVLAHTLVGSDPKHASPAEHQARPIADGWCRNYNGWAMFRAQIDGDTIFG